MLHGLPEQQLCLVPFPVLHSRQKPSCRSLLLPEIHPHCCHLYLLTHAGHKKNIRYIFLNNWNHKFLNDTEICYPIKSKQAKTILSFKWGTSYLTNGKGCTVYCCIINFKRWCNKSWNTIKDVNKVRTVTGITYLTPIVALYKANIIENRLNFTGKLIGFLRVEQKKCYLKWCIQVFVLILKQPAGCKVCILVPCVKQTLKHSRTNSNTWENKLCLTVTAKKAFTLQTKQKVFLNTSIFYYYILNTFTTK